MSQITRRPAHMAFAERLNRALDYNQVGISEKFKGRNEDLARMMTDANPGARVTKETISKWSKGDTLPRSERFPVLAQVLGVDQAWLQMGEGGDGPVYTGKVSLGSGPVIPQRARPPVAAAAISPETIAKNLGVALAYISGARIVEVPPSGATHFRVLAAGGATLSMHAVLGEQQEGSWRVRVPKDAEATSIFGILPDGPRSFKMIELYWDDLVRIAEGTGDGYEVVIDTKLTTGDVQWRELASFGTRPRL